MTRLEAFKIASQKYNALMTARTSALFNGGIEPVEADYNYKHGWILLEGFSFSGEEINGPVNQPYMD